MKLPSLPSSSSRASAALLACLAAGCSATPPPARVAGPAGVVRADEEARAAYVAGLLEELHPRVLALLPDPRAVEVEVWIQRSPHLYRFAGPSYEEADGFWAEDAGRIHLRESAASIERTLVHELVHASLGESWSALPGTIEEGLCDWVSAELWPEGAAEMRAGRLSAACFGTGGLELDVQALLPGSDEPLDFDSGLSARLMLQGTTTTEVRPEDVFTVRAGLSTTRLSPGAKKTLYGLGFLVVQRTIERIGLDGLHALCLRAEREGLDDVPADWLLDASGLTGADRLVWRDAIHAALGSAELDALLRMYPGLVIESIEHLLLVRALQRGQLATEADGGLEPREPRRMRVRVSVPGAARGLGLSLLVP